MLPKRQFRHKLPMGEINVVSLMDILTTLLFFLLLSTSFMHIAQIDGSGFLSNKLIAEQESKKPMFTLEVIFNDPRTATIWMGSLNGLRVNDPSTLTQYLAQNFTGNNEVGYIRKLQGNDLKTLLPQVQDALIPIKRAFPDESNAVVAFTDQIHYQEMVDAMQSVRSLGPKQDGFQVVNSVGQKEMTKVLFPMLVISEWEEVDTSRAPASKGRAMGGA